MHFNSEGERRRRRVVLVGRDRSVVSVGRLCQLRRRRSVATRPPERRQFGRGDWVVDWHNAVLHWLSIPTATAQDGQEDQQANHCDTRCNSAGDCWRCVWRVAFLIATLTRGRESYSCRRSLRSCCRSLRGSWLRRSGRRSRRRSCSQSSRGRSWLRRSGRRSWGWRCSWSGRRGDTSRPRRDT
jgi:hypothetical protein